MDLTNIHLLDLTPAALLGLVVLLLLLGRLVPRRTVDDAVRQMEYWREAHSNSEKARTAQKEQADELLESSRLTVQLLQSIRAEAEKRSG